MQGAEAEAAAEGAGSAFLVRGTEVEAEGAEAEEVVREEGLGGSLRQAVEAEESASARKRWSAVAFRGGMLARIQCGQEVRGNSYEILTMLLSLRGPEEDPASPPYYAW